MKGYELFARTLKDLRLGPVFGNPGSTEIPMLREIKDYVLTLHDSISVGMADGLAQYTGTPSVVNLHTLPGVANSMAFIHTARLNRSPVVITSGQQDNRHVYYDPLLSHDLLSLVGDAVKYRYEARNAEDIERSLKRAAMKSLEPPMGPVFVSFPMDVMEEESDYLGLAWKYPNTALVDMNEVEYVAKCIEEAASPAIISGSEIDAYGSMEDAVNFAEKVGCPVYAEPLSSRAGFRSDNHRFAGDILPATTAMNMLLMKNDLILNFGGDFTIYPYLQSPLLPGKKVITISLSPSFRYGEFITGHPGLFMRELTKIVKPKGDFQRPEDLSTGSAAARERRTMGVNFVLQKVRKKFHDYVIVDEAISSSVAVRKNLGYRDRSYFTAKSGQLGWATPAAAGISMKNPRVLEIIGDGSLMYTVQALWTISRYNLPVKVLVLDNQGYSILKSFSTSFYPGVEKAPFLSFKTDIVKISEAFGVETREGDESLDELDWLAEGETARVLVVHVDRSIPKLFF
ncbi:MAG: thiamine pyrophosphate-binding protein [Candidatus Thermoplasmatota archaeon]|nr:thiamine pyrophosphate-binding protein [Candidatus Thermoplasmatota archaeon]